MAFTSDFIRIIAQGLFASSELALTYQGAEIQASGYSRFLCGTASSMGSFAVSQASNAFTVTNMSKILMEEATGVDGFGSIDGIAVYKSVGCIFVGSTVNTIVINYDELPKFNSQSISVTIAG